MKKTLITLILYIIFHLGFVSLFYLIDTNNTKIFLDPLFNTVLISIISPFVLIEVDLKLRKYIK